jgi:hypothetical protein
VHLGFFKTGISAACTTEILPKNFTISRFINASKSDLVISNVEHKLVLHELELKLELELHILSELELELGAYVSELELELELNPYELELELRAYKKQMFRFEIHAYTFN